MGATSVEGTGPTGTGEAVPEGETRSDGACQTRTYKQGVSNSNIENCMPLSVSVFVNSKAKSTTIETDETAPSCPWVGQS